MKNKDLVWNTAVADVGGHYNSRSNFTCITDRFVDLARIEGYGDEDIEQYIREHMYAVFDYFEPELEAM